jgi:hypothetical protein
LTQEIFTLLFFQQSLTDLENSRDDLLFELHKLPNQAPADTIMLKEYFEDVNELSKFMGKQIKLGLERTLNTVRKEPTLIVTILRIIEREEKADAEADEACQYLTQIFNIIILLWINSLTAFPTKWIHASRKAKALEATGHGCACKKSCRKNYGHPSFGQVR